MEYVQPQEIRCAVCGGIIKTYAEAEIIRGIYGEGYRHADYAICMKNVNAEVDDD